MCRRSSVGADSSLSSSSSEQRSQSSSQRSTCSDEQLVEAGQAHHLAAGLQAGLGDRRLARRVQGDDLLRRDLLALARPRLGSRRRSRPAPRSPLVVDRDDLAVAQQPRPRRLGDPDVRLAGLRLEQDRLGVLGASPRPAPGGGWRGRGSGRRRRSTPGHRAPSGSVTLPDQLTAAAWSGARGRSGSPCSAAGAASTAVSRPSASRNRSRRASSARRRSSSWRYSASSTVGDVEPLAVLDPEGEGEPVRQVDDRLVLDLAARHLAGQRGCSSRPRRCPGSGPRPRQPRARRHGWQSARFQARRAPPAAAPAQGRIPRRQGTSRSASGARTGADGTHRSTPITSAEPPRRPASTPASASSTTAARAGSTPSRGAASRKTGIGLPLQAQLDRRRSHRPSR